jgi:putative membrane protein
MSEAILQVLRTGWDIHPTLIAPIAGLVALYVSAAAAGIRRGERLAPGTAAAFATAIATLLLVLHSPLHHLADDYLFSAHMLQHMVLTLVVPPLLLLGTPDWMIRSMVDRPVIRRLAHNRLCPVVAFMVFNVVFAYLHFPAIYDRLFAYELTHRVTHIVLLVTALLTWLPLASPIPDVIPRLSPPPRMLYCFLQTIPGGIVGALLSFVDWVIFRHYGVKPMLLGVSPMADQQMGGLLMWVVGGTYYLIILTVIFFRWADHEEQTAYGAPSVPDGGERSLNLPAESLRDGAPGRP